MCGAICFETLDPINKKRPSIRWAYDTNETLRSNGQGSNDWYCGQAWAEQAAEAGHRDRGPFQGALARDKDKLTSFLARRQGVIDRTVQRSLKPKRSGC